MTEEESAKIVNFMILRVGVLMLRYGHMNYIMKINYFYENFLLYSQASIRQTEGIVMMSKEGSIKIVNFMTLARARILVLYGMAK